MIKVEFADYESDIHAKAIIELLDMYASEPVGGGGRLSDFTRENLIHEFKKRNSIHCILAFDEDKPVGLMVCMEGFSTFACKPLLNVHDVAVVSESRGRGISRLLFEKAEQLARQMQCCKMTLEVLEGNDIACAAYKKFGFEPYQLEPEWGVAHFWEKKLINNM